MILSNVYLLFHLILGKKKKKWIEMKWIIIMFNGYNIINKLYINK